jgi:hypothetical protein
VSSFHAKDFYAFKGEFKWFDEKGNRDLKRHERFRDKLADIILEHADELIVFTSMVPIKDKGRSGTPVEPRTCVLEYGRTGPDVALLIAV